MTRPIDLPSEYRSRASKGGQAPDRTRFVDPWSEAPLIRYLAHLRHQYSGMGWRTQRMVSPLLSNRSLCSGVSVQNQGVQRLV